MKIRAVRPEEREQIALIYSNAYRVPLEEARGWAKASDLRNTRAIFEGKRLVSMLQIIPYQVWLGGRVVSMGGIGGVATWADRQGRGYASQLMLDSLRTMRQRKMWVSVLYPFSHRYYNKFGWEIAGHRIMYTELQQNHIIRFPEHELVDAGKNVDNIPLLDSVYEKMAVHYNLCIKRTKRLWQKKLDWIKKNNAQLYLIKDGREYIGWFICQNKRLGDGFESVTNEFAFINEKALRAMMGFLATLPNNVTKINVTAPYNIDLWRFLKEPFVSTKIKPEMQFRIVDIPQAVKSRGYRPGLNARIVIGIKDDTAEWNNGNWQLELEHGNIARIYKTSKTPDAECDIRTFSQLFCGYVSAESLAWQGRLQVKDPDPLHLLNQIFHDLPTHTQDWF
ncbi:GNAT family N-acetyltransferase [Candidatus Sumerlaeota bacterium]|nr:GNAT family N-acetyltransferase [Candidatus Sumerlaeota bacterium]